MRGYGSQARQQAGRLRHQPPQATRGTCAKDTAVCWQSTMKLAKMKKLEAAGWAAMGAQGKWTGRWVGVEEGLAESLPAMVAPAWRPCPRPAHPQPDHPVGDAAEEQGGDHVERHLCGGLGHEIGASRVPARGWVGGAVGGTRAHSASSSGSGSCGGGGSKGPAGRRGKLCGHWAARPCCAYMPAARSRRLSTRSAGKELITDSAPNTPCERCPVG